MATLKRTVLALVIFIDFIDYFVGYADEKR